MIPLSVPNLSGNEWKYIKECLDTNWVSSVGSYVSLFEKKVIEFTKIKYAVATSSGTTALHISLIIAGIQRGDFVIAPNITFVASTNSITYVGAEPILIDVNPDNWQMDLALLEKFLDGETIQQDKKCIHKATNRVIRAIMPVHVLGNMCDMEQLVRLCEKHNIVMIEDATEALGSYFNNKHAGSFGKLSCLSFNGNKIITTGGGGMILTNDEVLAKRAKHITTQAKADPDEYYHDEVGYNYRLVNILAAMGVAQMEQLPSFLERKKEINSKYNILLKQIDSKIKSQVITKGVSANYWLFTVSLTRSKELGKFLKSKGIEARPFWVPMNKLPAFRGCIYFNESDNSSMVYENCLSLPCSTNISDEQIEDVVKHIREFYS